MKEREKNGKRNDSRMNKDKRWESNKGDTRGNKDTERIQERKINNFLCYH